MKLKLKLPGPICFAVLGLLSLFSAPMQAQWTVFDPTSYVMFGKIWSEDVSTGVKMAQTVQQGQQLISQGLNTYNLAKQETTALRNKQFMQAAGVLSQVQPIPGHANWTLALRSSGGMAASAAAWQGMAAPGASLQNRIQIADSFGTSMLNSLGSCNAAAVQSDGAIGQLERVALSMNTLDNTHAALGGATNMGLTQQLRIQECQHNLQQQQAQVQMLRMMQQRDYENAQSTTYTHIDSVAQTNPMGLTHVSNTLLADIP